MNTPDLNPDDYCYRCNRQYRTSEESCGGCGFDPANSEEDENENDTARHLWRVKQGIERG